MHATLTVRSPRARAMRLALAGAVALGGACLPVLAQGDVRFVRPRHNATVLGPTEIEVAVFPPAATRVREVALFVDGEKLAVLAAPPWVASWDAGDSERGHRLEAIATFSDGSAARALIRTARLRIDYREDVTLVNVYAVVRDESGRYVTDLTANEFRVREDGRPQVIERFTAGRRPLRIAIVLDVSLTMEGAKIEAAREAALRFLDVLEPGDEGMVVTFSDSVKVVQGLTEDVTSLAEAISSARVEGGTALYDAIWQTAERVGEFEGRRVMVLLSDGRDEAASGLEPGSFHTLEEALERALRNEVMIWSIGIGRRLEQETDFYERQSLASILERLSDTTGGRLLLSPRPGRLRRAFEEVADDLRHQYLIAYVSDEPQRDGSWREISVTTTRPGLVVRGRKGYYAAERDRDGVTAGAGASGAARSD